MVKVGDKVTTFRDMSKEGVVVELKQSSVKTWMIGGAMSPELIAVVKLDKDEELVEYRCSDLMRLDQNPVISRAANTPMQMPIMICDISNSMNMMRAHFPYFNIFFFKYHLLIELQFELRCIVKQNRVKYLTLCYNISMRMRTGDTVWMRHSNGFANGARTLCLIINKLENGWFEILVKGQVMTWPEQELEAINEQISRYRSNLLRGRS